MSDNDNKPSKQTSSVPLKKETVRVTLKAADAPSASPAGAPPAPAAPKPTASAPKPPGAPKPPTASGGAPPAPAPTIPLKTAGAPAAGGAPAPAPTIKLNTAPAAGAPTVALKAGAPAAGGAPSVALPKATVQLQPPTQPMGTGGVATQAAAMSEEDEDDESGVDPVVMGLSVLGMLGAAAVLFFQVSTAGLWVEGEWSKLF